MPKVKGTNGGGSGSGKFKQEWATPGRKVLYKDYSEERRTGKNAVTIAEMKEILGYEEVGQGDDFLFRLPSGKKVRFNNNVNNRPFHLRLAEEFGQKFLNLAMRYNGESFIIGCTGRVISGQHRGAGMLIAEDRRTGSQAGQWEHLEPVTFEVLLVRGVHEDRETVNTVDNVRARTLKDVLFTDPELFKDLKYKDRLQVLGMADHATKMLWVRTGMNTNAFNGIRTHDEAANFIYSHPKLREALEWIYKQYEVNYSNAVRIMTPGYAAALLYLMGSCESDGDHYRNLIRQGQATEGSLDWAKWDRAKTFWASIASGKLVQVKQALGTYYGMNDTGRGASREEKVAILINAWNLYKRNKRFNNEDIELKYNLDKDGNAIGLKTIPVLGGIDMQEEPAAPKRSKARPEEGDDKGSASNPPVTPPPPEDDSEDEDGEPGENANEYDLIGNDHDEEDEDHEEELEGVAGLERQPGDPSPEEIAYLTERARERRERAERVREMLEKLPGKGKK